MGNGVAYAEQTAAEVSGAGERTCPDRTGQLQGAVRAMAASATEGAAVLCPTRCIAPPVRDANVLVRVCGVRMCLQQWWLGTRAGGAARAALLECGRGDACGLGGARVIEKTAAWPPDCGGRGPATVAEGGGCGVLF